MTMTNMGTYSTVNGVQEYTTDNLLTSATASATNESILLTGSGTIRASGGSAVIAFTNCNICLNDVVNVGNWYDSGTAPLTYYGDSNDRNNTSLGFNFVDCSIIHRTTTTKAIFLGDLTNTKVFREKVSGGGTFRVYTQGNANLDGMLLDSVTWEPVLQFSSASNVTLQNTGTGFTNFNVPRMDFLYITEINVNNSASLGVGNGGNNSIVIINAISFDDTTISMGSVNSKYFKIITSSWNFRDRDDGTDVEDALVIVNSDKSGSMTELGRYTTDSDGLMTGTYDSLNETTGSSQVRETLYIWPSYSDTAGSSHGTGSFTYDLIDIDTEVEIRAYGYEPPVGYVAGDTYAITTPQGTLNADYSVAAYQVFTMNNDLNMTESNKATVLAYVAADLGDPNKLYDRSRAEWRDNDDYPVIGRVGAQLDLDTIDLVLDGTAASDYAATTTTITAKQTTYTGGATSTTGDVTVLNGTLLSGGTFDCDINYQSGAGSTITNVTCTGTVDFNAAGTYTIDSGTVNNVTSSVSGVILVLINGATVTTNSSPSNITLQNPVTVRVTALDATGAPVVGAQVYLEAGAGGDLPQGTEILNAPTNGSGIAEDTAFNYTNDQLLQNSRVRRGTTSPLYITSTVSGTIEDMGLNSIVIMVSDE